MEPNLRSRSFRALRRRSAGLLETVSAAADRGGAAPRERRGGADRRLLLLLRGVKRRLGTALPDAPLERQSRRARLSLRRRSAAETHQEIRDGGIVLHGGSHPILVTHLRFFRESGGRDRERDGEKGKKREGKKRWRENLNES